MWLDVSKVSRGGGWEALGPGVDLRDCWSGLDTGWNPKQVVAPPVAGVWGAGREVLLGERGILTGGRAKQWKTSVPACFLRPLPPGHEDCSGQRDPRLRVIQSVNKSLLSSYYMPVSFPAENIIVNEHNEISVLTEHSLVRGGKRKHSTG